MAQSVTATKAGSDSLSPQELFDAGSPKRSANERQVGGQHYQGVYTQQHWDYAWERRFDQFQYNITKRVERWRRKDGLQDLLKARHELDKYIELIEAGKDPFSASASDQKSPK